MKFGINTFLFTSPFTTADIQLFPKFKSWGFDCVEIALEDASHINVKTVRQALDDHGLSAPTLCAAFGPDRDLRGTRAQQIRSMDYIRSLMDLMPELGASVLAGPMYSAVGRAQLEKDSDKKVQWETVVKNLSTLGKEAHANHIRLALEPLNRYETDLINTCAQALQMIRDVGSPALAIHLDTFHMNLEEKDPAAAIHAAGDRLALLHASGSDRGTPGKDQINWHRIFDALREVSYNGPVSIESFTPNVKIIAKAASIWRTSEPSEEKIAMEGLAFLQSLA